jgi:competence protein ComEC
MIALAILVATCTAARTQMALPAPAAAPSPPAAMPPGACTLRVHFYDVAQGLAALVDLPDGRHILVDTGDGPKRAGCGASCSTAHDHLLSALHQDLRGGSLDMLWITHQHGDHIGGAPDIAGAFQVSLYVDYGREADVAEVMAARKAAALGGARLAVVDPQHRAMPLSSSPAVRIRPVLPAAWPTACAHDENDCSIGLRLDACGSSVLFTGDAEIAEESSLDPGGPVGLLQVGHHGSDTSTSDTFLARAHPTFAVISAGHEAEGTNRTYCHPRATTVRRLTQALGGAGRNPIHAFDGNVACRGAGEDHWADIPASDHLWATERDGDIVLRTSGDGMFRREE